MVKYHRFVIYSFILFLSLTCLNYLSFVGHMMSLSNEQPVDKQEEYDPSKCYNSSCFSVSVERRTSDGAVFITIDKVPYHITSDFLCPSIPLIWTDVESPSNLDKVSSKQIIASFIGYRDFCGIAPEEDDITDIDGYLVSDETLRCNSPPAPFGKNVHERNFFIERMCNHKNGENGKTTIDHILHVPMLSSRSVYNQRIRTVHDLVSSLLINSAVEISYQLSKSLWEIYDKVETLAQLNHLGICLYEATHDENDAVEIEIQTPYTSTDLSFLIRSGKLRLHDYKWMFNLNGQYDVVDNGNLIPNTCHSLQLLQSINSAFISSKKVMSYVDKILLTLFKIDMQRDVNPPPYITIHWPSVFSSFHDRDNVKNTDMSSFDYIQGLTIAFKSLHDDVLDLFDSNNVRLVFIGDISSLQMAYIETSLQSVISFHVTVHDISSVMRKKYKDVSSQIQEQVNYEIALLSTLFVGMPYDPFSQVVSMERQKQNKKFHFVQLPNKQISSIVKYSFPSVFISSTRLSSKCVKTENEQIIENRLNGKHDDGSSVGVGERRKRILLSNQSSSFPFDKKKVIKNSGKSLIPRGYDGVKNKLMFRDVHEFIDRSGDIKQSSLMPNAMQQERCLDLAPNFKFDVKLDDPVRHGGKVCSIAVVTALFGHQDKLHGYHNNMATFRKEEFKNNLYSCWFAFVDHDAAHSVNDKLIKSTCSSPHKTLKHGIWDLVIMDSEMMPFSSEQMNKNSRVPKMLMHRAFDYASYLIYQDSKLHWLSLSNIYQFSLYNLNSNFSSWVSPRHPERQSLYQEARCAILVGLISDTDEVYQQMSTYFKEGMPAYGRKAPLGLIEGEWHLRNLKSKASSKQGCDWFREYSRWNHGRDQLSFNYILYNISLTAWDEHEDTSGSILDNQVIQRRDKVEDFFFEYRNNKRWPFRRLARTPKPSQTRLSSSICNLPNKEHKAAELIKKLWRSRKWQKDPK